MRFASSASWAPGGSVSNAAFVGMNTVRGPGPFSTSNRLADRVAFTKAEKSGFAAAISAMVRLEAGIVPTGAAVAVGETAPL